MTAIKTIKWAYDTLGIPFGATTNEAKQAYRELVMVWHPDRFQNDARLQHRALEMLKNINQAYQLVREAIATGADCNATDGAELSGVTVLRPQAPPRSKQVDPAPSTPHASSLNLDVLVLQRFNAWQNLVFLAFAVLVVWVSTARFGSIFSGAGYALELLALPVIFAIACNMSRLRSNKATWAAYVAIVCISTVIVIIDSMIDRNDLKDASYYSGASTGDVSGSSGAYRGALPSSYPGEPLPLGASKVPAGPAPPRSPYVEAPLAPVVPEAPAAPVAPMAAPAR